ncbi:hypothetical protein F4680DRAFT_418313 [Xylaria scruposa]|nr:hypothetical protein F4680DRAFT_418313 [Xylaria scruposa]
MPRSKPDQDFKIYVDSSCLNTPMDEETISLAGDVEKNDDIDMTRDTDELRPSIETDDSHDISAKDEEIGDSSILSDRTDHSFHPDDGDQSSSQHEGTDEDVFTDKSSRSSMGSYDASSDCGKGDGTTIITRSPRISDISQYDKEDFVPTARGTPRPPFRTPSDVRAMQMSSPAGSVVGSPRSSRKHFPTGSRLGTPSASAQYSPKRRSTPPRFKSRQEAPLVLLHVTLLPLRWMWGDLVNNLDPIEMSEQVKTLRSSWRILQDRVGDTVIERGILLGHPQNDYEVLEERVLEALELPVRRRARILECGHYLGPSNETTLTEEEEGEESEDEHAQHRRQSDSKHHWCATCKSEIRYDALGEAKVFRVKVYASNGLMRAGAWEACWKEMERVDVELEPIVEPAVQDEIVRLAAAQQEREIAQQEEADIAKEVAMQFEEQRRSEEHKMRQEQARSQSSSPPTPEVIPEAVHEHTRESRSPRSRHRDEERLREIYGDTPPPPESHSREPSSHRYRDPEISTPPPRSPEKEVHEPKDNGRRGYQSASLSELLLQSARVLMQDRKNVIIFTLGLFVLILSLRRTPPESTYEPIIYRLKNMPEVQQLSTVDTLQVAPEQQRPMEARPMESIVTTPSFGMPHDTPSQANSIYQEASPSYEAPLDEPSQPNFDYEEVIPIIEQQSVVSASQTESQPTQDTFTAPASVATVYEPCGNPTILASLESTEVLSPILDAQVAEIPVQEIIEETVHQMVEEIEITTERKVVKVVQTVTRTQTQTQTQTETQTEVEMATAVETVIVQATEVPQLETSSDVEEEKLGLQDDAALVEEKSPNDEIAEADPQVDSVPDAMLETESESLVESVAEPTAEPEEVPVEA